jgi:hypothetical protein
MKRVVAMCCLAIVVAGGCGSSGASSGDDSTPTNTRGDTPSDSTVQQHISQAKCITNYFIDHPGASGQDAADAC